MGTKALEKQPSDEQEIFYRLLRLLFRCPNLNPKFQLEASRLRDALAEAGYFFGIVSNKRNSYTCPTAGSLRALSSEGTPGLC